MEPQDQKTIDRLVKAVELAYNSPGRMFWRGFLGGLGRGFGYLIGFLILVTVLYFLFKQSGLGQSFKEVYETIKQIGGTLDKIPWQK